ncbi:hypothetical protein CCP3SC1AL1_250020 [Gammaproteobacteria bacterium]
MEASIKIQAPAATWGGVGITGPLLAEAESSAGTAEAFCPDTAGLDPSSFDWVPAFEMGSLVIGGWTGFVVEVGGAANATSGSKNAKVQNGHKRRRREVTIWVLTKS